MPSVSLLVRRLQKRSAPGKTPCPLLMILLAAFLGHILIQAVSFPDEAPCRTIDRLVGINIATPFPFSDGHGPHHDMLSMGHHDSIHNSAHHHQKGEDACPLCSLLAHILLALSPLLLYWAASSFQQMKWARPTQPRAPPMREAWQFPPSRAPPLFSESHIHALFTVY